MEGGIAGGVGRGRPARGTVWDPRGLELEKTARQSRGEGRTMSVRT